MDGTVPRGGCTILPVASSHRHPRREVLRLAGTRRGANDSSLQQSAGMSLPDGPDLRTAAATNLHRSRVLTGPHGHHQLRRRAMNDLTHIIPGRRRSMGRVALLAVTILSAVTLSQCRVADDRLT